MLDGGCDPRYIARRVLRMASEDIGNADPRALTLALAACEVYERLGTPEGELAIAQAVVFMACAAKSNAVYVAFGAAMEDAKTHGTADVPLRLRNAPTGLMKGLGYGAGYRYAHDEPDAFAAGETLLSRRHDARALLRAGAARARDQDCRSARADGGKRADPVTTLRPNFTGVRHIAAGPCDVAADCCLRQGDRTGFDRGGSGLRAEFDARPGRRDP
jgi:hypothetical protein